MATKIIDKRAAHQKVDRAASIRQLEQLQGRLEYELTPVLAALELLADSQRILADITAAADDAPDENDAGQLTRLLAKACPSWRSAQRYDEDGALTCCQQLAFVAVHMSAEIARETESALQELRRSETPA